MAKPTRWRVVYDDLRGKIASGEYPPGAPLPTERDLVEEYGFSRDTIRRAFAELEQAGLVAGRPSTGRTVREPLDLWFDASKFERVYADDPERGLDQWGQDVAAQGWEPHQTVSTAWVAATRQVGKWLDVEPGVLLLRRRRIRMVRKDLTMPWAPVIIADSWFPEHIARRTTVDGLAPLLLERNITLGGGIMRAIGIRQAHFIDEVRARMPRNDERKLLQLLPGTPILELARVGQEADGSRIRVIVNTIDAGSQYLKYVLDVPHPATPVQTSEDKGIPDDNTNNASD